VFGSGETYTISEIKIIISWHEIIKAATKISASEGLRGIS